MLFKMKKYILNRIKIKKIWIWTRALQRGILHKREAQKIFLGSFTGRFTRYLTVNFTVSFRGRVTWTLFFSRLTKSRQSLSHRYQQQVVDFSVDIACGANPQPHSVFELWTAVTHKLAALNCSRVGGRGRAARHTSWFRSNLRPYVEKPTWI